MLRVGEIDLGSHVLGIYRSRETLATDPSGLGGFACPPIESGIVTEIILVGIEGESDHPALACLARSPLCHRTIARKMAG